MKVIKERLFQMLLSAYRSKIHVLDGGERIPLLIDALTGLPDQFTADYSLANHRGKSIATTKQSVDAIGMCKSWARTLGIDLDHRLSSFLLFSSDELTSLAEHLSINRRPRLNGVARSVVGATQASRIDHVIAYIQWRVGLIVTTLAHDDPNVSAANARLALTTEQLKGLRRSSTPRKRGQLTENQCERLFSIVRPDSDENPFRKQTRQRNYVILLAYYELGIRRCEILTLKGRHASIGPRSTFHITYTPNDVSDPRQNPPSLKTVARLLPISKTLASAYDRLLKERRSNPRTQAGAKKTEFVLLSTESGDPLSVSSIDDIFVILRERFPKDFPSNFSSHHLRRTWNYRFSKACEEAGTPDDLADQIQRYVMGWSVQSSQPSNYNQVFIEEQTFKIMISMQDALTDI